LQRGDRRKGGYVIQIPGRGEVVFCTSDGKEAIRTHTGDSVLLQNAIRLLQACQGQVIVSTTDQKLCLAVLAHAQVLNVPCTAELYKERGKLYGFVAGFIVDAIAIIWLCSGTPWPTVLLGFIVMVLVASFLVPPLVGRVMGKRMCRAARERGLALLNKFPHANATDRHAKNADAVRQGWV
jgi:hypothetical protein